VSAHGQLEAFACECGATLSREDTGELIRTKNYGTRRVWHFYDARGRKVTRCPGCRAHLHNVANAGTFPRGFRRTR
jgi:hypothetical protein